MENISKGRKVNQYPSCALAKSGNEWLQRNVISTIILLILATAHVSSDAISKRDRSLPGAEFINGLANSMRRIHSSKLATISKNSPFQLEFRTECPSSNLIFNEKFVIHVNHEGNLAYLNKENNETKVYSRVANGQWHALNFNGSAITFLGSYDQSLSETTFSEIPILLSKLNDNEHSEESDHDLLYFFDGFVGCVRINSENSTVANVLYHPSSEIDTNTDEHSGDDEFGHAVDDHSNESEVNVSSIFQLFTIFSGCTDLNHDLKDSHHCHNPDSFVYCEKCKGKCVEKGADQNKRNECNCTNINSEGTRCKISLKESAEPESSRYIYKVNPNPANFQELTGITPSRNVNSSLLHENSSYDNSILTTPASTTTPNIIPVQTQPDMSLLPCPCENGGFCTSHDVDARCNCPSGFYGEHCEKIECSPSTCVEGVCQNSQCYCTPGYTGNHCEIDINECNPDPCYKNWTDHCEQGINRFTCICLPGFTSKLCDLNIDECASGPCQNGAACIDGINTYTCRCLPGFDGVNCENNIDECTVAGDEPKCFNNGTCIDKINEFDCNCTNTGFEGLRCENNIDDCRPDSCQHGGICVDQINGYKCNCYPGYTGYNCQSDINECASHNNSSVNGSQITNNTSPCVEGSCFEFSNESLYVRTAWEHGNIPKEFRANFSYANASGFFCQCPDGFEGLNCEINLNECELVAGTHPCIHGKCIDGRNNYTCECKPGYASRNCEIDIDECKSSPCAQGGKCIDQIADFECKCPDGYGSKDCSIALTGCMPQNPCLNSGNCTPDYVNHQQVFNCSCPNGFSGQLCEILTTMSFNGSNYLTVSSNDDNYKNGTYEMEFRFKTTLSNVLVAVGQGTTYFMLTLADGRLNLQSSLLNSLNGISSGLNLSNAVWHKAWILVNESHISLAANSEQTIHPINNEDGTQGQTGFNMTVLGGATPPLNFLNKELVGFFVGCVQDVKINGKQIVVPKDKNTNITVVNDVGIGCTRKEQCKPLNPCLNGGQCTDLWQKYQCQCLRPFLGYKCEFQYQPGTFGNENTTMSIAEVIIPPEVSRKFSNSFVISMFVRTRESRGTIFFLGDDTRENGFFIQAQVEEDGQLGVVSKLDEAKEETYTVGGLQINNGFPYLISVQKEKGLVKISINKTEHFRKSVKEKIQFSPTIMLIGGVLPHNSDLNESNDFEDSTLLPGVDAPARVFPTLSSSFKMKQFKGVIQDVRVNLSSTDVTPSSSSHDHFVVEFFPLNVTMKYSMGESLGHVNLHGEVLEGVISDQTCTSSPCLNGGTCVVTWNDFECGCIQNVYAGKTCDVLLRCAMVTCPKQSQCRNINATGFECIAEVALDGRGTVSPHYRLKSNDTENLNFNAISFRYRSRSGGSIIYLSGGTSTLRVALEYDAYIRDGVEDADRSNFLSVYFNSTRYNFNVLTGLDGEWHSVELGFASNNFTLKYDGVHLDKGKMVDFHMSSTFFNDIVSSHAGQIIVGSYIREGNEYNHVADTGPLQTSLIHHMESLHDAFFKGCLADVKIGNYELPFVSPELLYEANENNISLVETTAPTAFYIENSVSLHLGCILCYEDECRNGGKCENAPAVYDCACKDGYSGAICQTNIDECVNNICAQGSNCVDQVANYTCECSKGYAGWLCDEDEDECNSSPCKHGGFCINLPADSGFYKCNCTDDYTGDNCERRKLSTCQNENEPCENGAKCRTVPIRPDGVSFVCECPTGYEGTVCEKQIDYCANVTCANGGTCNNALVGFQCLCMPGWDGPKCETDRNECALPEYKGVPPCKNNGTCIDGINEFTCNCSGTGFTGEYCEVDVDECENYHVQEECFQRFSKICVNTPGSYECDCPPELCGIRCNFSNPCQKLKSNETCKNGGRCMPMCDDDPDKWMCKCSEGFEGQTCATTLSSTREQTLNIALIVIPVLTAFLLASVIAIFILVKMARKKRATRGVYSPSQQEYCNPRTELDLTLSLKPPPEERLI